MGNMCVLRHLSWINHGYSFHDISRLRESITARTGVEHPDSEMIHESLGFSDPSIRDVNVPLEDLTFLFVDTSEFKGSFSVIEEALYLNALHLGRSDEKEKITCLGTPDRLKNLRTLNLPHQQITDIAPLSNNLELEEVNLKGNPLESIKPLFGHRNLKRAAFSSIAEDEIILLLQNAQQAIISYENQESCYAFWIDQWAFKGSFIPTGDRIEFFLEPIAEQDPIIHVSPTMFRALLHRCREIGKTLVCQELVPGEFNFTYDQSVTSLTGHFKFQANAYS